MIRKTWTIWEQYNECQTKMKDEQVRCCNQWYQRRQTDQEDINKTVLRAYGVNEVIIDVA